MKYSHILTTFLVSAVLLACGKSDEQRQIEVTLNNSVMELHDEIMPTTMTLQDYENQLAQLKTAVADLNPTATDSIDVTITLLKSAREGMMDWMNNHSSYDPEMEHEKMMDILRKDMEGIKSVKMDMDTALEMAKELINRYNK